MSRVLKAQKRLEQLIQKGCTYQDVAEAADVRPGLVSFLIKTRGSNHYDKLEWNKLLGYLMREDKKLKLEQENKSESAVIVEKSEAQKKGEAIEDKSLEFLNISMHRSVKLPTAGIAQKLRSEHRAKLDGWKQDFKTGKGRGTGKINSMKWEYSQRISILCMSESRHRLIEKIFPKQGMANQRKLANLLERTGFSISRFAGLIAPQYRKDFDEWIYSFDIEDLENRLDKIFKPAN